MNFKRLAVFVGVLLASILAYAYQFISHESGLSTASNAGKEESAGDITLTAVKVDVESSEVPNVEFDYHYSGAPQGAYFSISLERGTTSSSAVAPEEPRGYAHGYLVKGQQHVKMEIKHPGVGVLSTTAVTVSFLAGNGKSIVSERIERVIDWPDAQTWLRNREFATMSSEAMLKRAVELIDSEDEEARLEAKSILERIVQRDKRYAPAYIELARVAMKSSWGPEGLHHAENLLASALQIDAQSVNAKILLGYVYTHQKHFAKAEALFSEAAATDTKNLWLWSNWGELLSMKGDFGSAAKKYREAINRPLGHDTYDRARLDAYRKLLVMSGRNSDLDGMEALYKQRAEEFAECGCYTEYAQFLIERRGNADAAIELTKKAIASGNDVEKARRILGVAYYLKWATLVGDERTEVLNQARVYLPEGPTALYLLAANDRTANAAKQLISNGESIDQFDNEKLTALALALQNQDSAATRRLLRMGARADVLVGHEDMPVALIPVFQKDIAAIKILQQSGVDYSKVRYRGMTAIEFARQVDDGELLKALKQSGLTT